MRWTKSLVIACAIGASLFQAAQAGPRPNSFPVTADLVLSSWEAASQSLLGAGPMEDRRLYHLHQGTHSAHEITLFNELRGPVSAADLLQRFTWSVEARGKTILIVGTPTDEVERLFFQKVAVTLDAETHLPKAVRFQRAKANALGEELAVVVARRMDEPHRFQPDRNARPLLVASRQGVDHQGSPVRVVEHVTLLPVHEHRLPENVRQTLHAWEQSARQIQSLKANITRKVYELHPGVEHRAAGSLTYAFPPVVHCTLKPTAARATETSERKTSAGVPYDLLPSPPEHWEYTPAELRFYRDPGEPAFVLRSAGQGNRQVCVVTNPESAKEALSSIPVIAPWPMLFQASAKQLAARFEIRVHEESQPLELEFIPKEQGDFGQFRTMRVYLDSARWLPETVQFLNARGDVEIVYTFEYTDIIKQQSPHREPRLLPVKNNVPKLEPAPTDLHGQP